MVNAAVIECARGLLRGVMIPFGNAYHLGDIAFTEHPHHIVHRFQHFYLVVQYIIDRVLIGVQQFMGEAVDIGNDPIGGVQLCPPRCVDNQHAGIDIGVFRVDSQRIFAGGVVAVSHSRDAFSVQRNGKKLRYWAVHEQITVEVDQPVDIVVNGKQFCQEKPAVNGAVPCGRHLGHDTVEFVLDVEENHFRVFKPCGLF